MGLSGFVNIIKPTGESSSNVVCKVKKILGTKKVGHLGTLDPAASGVLPIAVGKATKFFDYFLSKDKEYIALVQFGIQTDTLDSFGLVEQKNDIIISEENIKSVLNDFIGEIDQIPPKYSAIKINGKRACDLARENTDFEIKSRKTTIYSIKLLQKCEKNQFLFRVHCSAGTYIRTLFSDIAEKMGTISTTPVIIRTKSGLFEMSNSITLAELEKFKTVQKIEDVFSTTTIIEVNDFIANKLINGVKIWANSIKIPENCKKEFFVKYKNNLIGLYNINGEFLNPIIYLYEGER